MNPTVHGSRFSLEYLTFGGKTILFNIFLIDHFLTLNDVDIAIFVSMAIPFIKWQNTFLYENIDDVVKNFRMSAKKLFKCFKRNQMKDSAYISEVALQRCSYEKVFWKYAANLQEKTHAEVRF